MSIKTKTIGALFVALAIILAVKPMYIHNAYHSILGRLLLIAAVIFFSVNNVTLGLLVALAIIAASNQFSPLVEGLENGTTIGEDNTSAKGSQVVLTGDAAKKIQELTPEQQEQAKNKMSDLKEKINAAGVDLEAIKNTIKSKDSKTIPIDPSAKSSEEVSAFTPSMLGSSSLEGFSAF
jgi:membrane glycosyltransferase